MSLESLDVCELVWSLLVADNGVGGVNRLVGGTASAPGRIYRDRVPAASVLPAVTIALVVGNPTRTLGAVHVLATVEVDVRVIGEGSSYAAIGPIAERANAVLDGAVGVRDQTYAVKLAQLVQRAFPEDDAGKSYTHILTTYDTKAAPLPT